MTLPPNSEGTSKPEEDPLGGVDPLVWLESLARRQGANPEELITAANLDVPLPSAAPSAESPRPQASTEPPAPEPALQNADDPLGGVDPLVWLESLARRQGANPEELITAANLDVPLPSAEADITAPGYTDFDPFSAGTLSARARAVEPPAAQESVAPADDPMAWLEALSSGQAADDPMAWLASLGEPSTDAVSGVSAEAPSVQGMTPDEALAWLDSLSAEPAPEPAQTIPPIEASGLSGEPREMPSWLTEQLDSPTQTRDAEIEDALADLPPAEPATSLPDWLSEAVVDPTLPAARATLELEIKPPAPPEDLPKWLIEEPAADLDLDLGDDFIPPQTPLPQVPEASLELDPQEIERMIKPSSPEEVDDLAEYFDEEYDRRLAGDETIPLWYLEALQRAESALAAPPSAVAAPEPEPKPAEPAAASDVPSWLLEMQPETSPPPARTSAALPEELSWLEALAEGLPEETPAAPIEPPIVEPVAIERPGWSASTGKQDLAAVEPHEAERAAAEQAAPAAAPPLVHKVEPVITLQQARQQVAQGQLLPALERYQALVDAMQNLEEVRADMRQLVEQYPKEPKVRRLLGDTHMRLGDLQAALDTYLAALREL